MCISEANVIPLSSTPPLTSQERVSVGCLDLEDTPHDLQDGHIEGATTQVVHADGALLLVGAVRERGSWMG